MSQGIDIDFVRETYQKMSDEDLIRVLTTDAAGLTTEAQALTRNEVKRRNLNPDIALGVDIQQKFLNDAEIDAYCSIIQFLPCPVTGETTEILNGTMVSETVSFILFTSVRNKIIVRSPAALDKENNAAILKSILLAPWAIPWGPIRTVQGIRLNLKSKRTNHSGAPNEYLKQFVREHIGVIETYKNDKDKLREIISG